MDTGAVIVGDIVLHFLGRISTHEAVLELAVAYSATSRLGMFLNQLGFTSESSPSGDHSFASLFYEQEGFPEEWGEDGEALLCSFDFIRPSNASNSVRILVVRVCPVDYVLDLPCTAAMNFITHRSAYSLYPLDTFGRSRSLCLSERGQSMAADALIAKLADEGFAPLRWLYEQEAGDASVPFGRCYRFVGDEHTWVLPVWPDLDCVDSDVDLAMWQSWCLRFHAYLPPTSRRTYSAVAGPVMKRRYVSGHPLDSSAPTLGCVFADSRLRGQFYIVGRWTRACEVLSLRNDGAPSIIQFTALLRARACICAPRPEVCTVLDAYANAGHMQATAARSLHAYASSCFSAIALVPGEGCQLLLLGEQKRLTLGDTILHSPDARGDARLTLRSTCVGIIKGPVPVSNVVYVWNVHSVPVHESGCDGDAFLYTLLTSYQSTPSPSSSMPIPTSAQTTAALSEEVLTLINLAFSERDDAVKKMDVANANLLDMKDREALAQKRELEARDVQQQLALTCRRQAADLREAKRNFVLLYQSVTHKLLRMQENPDSAEAVVVDVEQVLKPYEVTKMKYDDDDELERSFVDESHM
ncbi:uncharacterized protein SCHCODRAFT_02519969 [Schizophyllum commune H4-8]|nr:uncharacterized protein SCHCODRAFT_02519969 [Schizophyllum commune H4-8]KAI5885498.1 hypothetical protein SCHCODRAFT_02519969 [Schizophyllum commune H4-8]